MQNSLWGRRRLLLTTWSSLCSLPCQSHKVVLKNCLFLPCLEHTIWRIQHGMKSLVHHFNGHQILSQLIFPGSGRVQPYLRWYIIWWEAGCVSQVAESSSVFLCTGFSDPGLSSAGGTGVRSPDLHSPLHLQGVRIRIDLEGRGGRGKHSFMTTGSSWSDNYNTEKRWSLFLWGKCIFVCH